MSDIPPMKLAGFCCCVRIRPVLPHDKDPVCMEWDEREGAIDVMG